MFLENDKYKVKITIDSNFKEGSMNNYDFIFRTIDNENNFKVFRIEVKYNNKLNILALIGDINSYDENCAVLEDNLLIVLQNRIITKIDLSENIVLSVIKTNNLGYNLGIYRCEGGYIIHGETNVFKINYDLKEEWSFSGNDIFVTQSGFPSFVIEKNRIKLHDWNNAYYELDFDGNLIRNIYADNTDMDFQI